MTVVETARLSLRRLTADDTPFILRLLNEPSFIQNIGDRGVRSVDDARKYLVDGPMASYQLNGFGLYLVELRATEAAEAAIPDLALRSNATSAGPLKEKT